MFCSSIDDELLKNLKISYKKTADGIVIVMTSSKQIIVTKLHKSLERCFLRGVIGAGTKGDNKELILSPQVVKKIEYLNNGIRLELSSNDEKMIPILQNFKFIYSKNSARGRA